MQKEEPLADIWTVYCELQTTQFLLDFVKESSVLLQSLEASCDLYVYSVRKLVLSQVCIHMSHYVLYLYSSRKVAGLRKATQTS